MHTIEIAEARIANEHDGNPIIPLYTVAAGRYCNESTKQLASARLGIAGAFIRLINPLQIESVRTPARAIAVSHYNVARRFFDGVVPVFQD